MPYKDPDRKKKYMRNYMRGYQSARRQAPGTRPSSSSGDHSQDPATAVDQSSFPAWLGVAPVLIMGGIALFVALKNAISFKGSSPTP